jgi:hypothetical protein
MARMLVEVTRVELIPTTTVDHTYDGEGYELILKVEGENSKINLMYICRMLILQKILRMWKLKARMIKPRIPKVDRLSLLQLLILPCPKLIMFLLSKPKTYPYQCCGLGRLTVL